MTDQERQSRAAWERFKRVQADRAAGGAGAAARIPPAGAAARIAPAVIDAPERVKSRLRHIRPDDGLGRERIFGQNDLLPVNYLTLGRRASRPVCRIQVRDTAGRHAGFGTGFLVSPDLLLTNHHVFPAAADALRSLAEFDVEEDEDFRPLVRRTFRLEPGRFFVSDVGLDFALVAVQARAQDDTPLAGYGVLPLVGEPGKVLVNEAVTLIHHPTGSDKQISLRNNTVLGLVDDFIHYTTDSNTGSSGAPVFNDQWQVVALHHRAVARRDDQGRVLARGGGLWDPATGEDQIDWVSNEGARVSSLFKWLRAKADWTARDRELLGGMGLGGLPLPPAAVARERAARPVGRDGLPGVAAPVITIDEFHRLVDDPATTEDDLAPYVQVAPEWSGAFDPVFRVNRSRVIDPRGLESDRALTWANSWTRGRRQRAYRRKVRDAGGLIKIVSEGDSWFQYPFILDDVIDHLMAEPDLAVFSLDAAGDLLSGMIASGEYLSAIADEQPSVFLISGGGNDMVADGRMAERLHRFTPGRPAADYPNTAFEAFLHDLRLNYRRLFASVTTSFPGVRILCHSYDNAIPNRGPWLGEPMERIDITDRTLQAQIVRVLMDRVSVMLRETVAEFAGVTYLDLREKVGDGDWYDELHPTSRGFKRVADVFAGAIRGGP